MKDISQLVWVTVVNSCSAMAEQQLLSPEKYIVKRSKASFTSSERRIILHVYGVLRGENPDMTKRQVAERVSVLTGASRGIIEKIRQEFEKGPLVTPGKKRPRRVGQRTRMKMYSDFERTGIKRKVHSLYRQNVPPTAKKVNQMMNDDPDLPNVSISTTTRLLNDLGFKFEKRERRSILIEREDIVRWRRRYLKEIKNYRTEGRKIYYLDETWCNAGHTVKKAWTPKYIKSSREAFMTGETTGLRDIPGRGGRLIIVHIGSEDGFLKDPTDPTGKQDARWVFRAKKTAKVENANHHDEMNSKAFEEWFTGILHVLPSDSVIVMDNASYHSETIKKLPNMKWKKQEVQEWLTENGVYFDVKDVKTELIARIPDHLRLSAKTYKIDKIAEEFGHIVLRLPPYHCDLNPIELVWATVKNEVARNNCDYTLSAVEGLLNDALNNISTEDWRKAVEHVREVEKLMWELEAITDDIQDNFIINLAEDSDSDSDSDQQDIEEDSEDDLAFPL